MAPRKDPVVEDILKLLGVTDPKPAAPVAKSTASPPIVGVPRGEERWYEHLASQEDTTDTAHVIMPTDLVERYREYVREVQGDRQTAAALRKVVEQQGIRSPLWISTDGKKGLLVEGNNRLAVAKDLGIGELPVRITYDKQVQRNQGAEPVPLDPLLKKWVEENRIPGKYGQDAFPPKGIDVKPERLGFPEVPEDVYYHLASPHAAREIVANGFNTDQVYLSTGPRDAIGMFHRGAKEGKDFRTLRVQADPARVVPDPENPSTWRIAKASAITGVQDISPGSPPPRPNVVTGRTGVRKAPVVGPPGLESVAPITRSRKSRSYASPEHQADILRYAPEDAYRNAVRDVNHRVVQYVQDAYRSGAHFMTDQEHIDRLTALMAPAVQAGQLQIADLTNAHLASLFGVKDPPPPDVSMFERQGVSRTTELARPFWTAIKAAREGKDFDAALAAGEQRLTKMVETDLQMAKVRQAREVLKAGHIQTYARVVGSKPCWLCAIAATQVYYTEDLLPIHPGCNCSVKPIPKGGERAIRNGFNPDEILAATDDQMKMMSSLVESEAPLSKYQDKLAIRDHGEIGPMLTWKHQNFIGPTDLPVPPSREVVEHQAYEAVKKNGGVTIDLGGHVPANGYAYAPFKDTEMVVPQGSFTPEHIDRFINMHADELAKPGNHLGMWTQNGNVYLDISRVGDPTTATLAKAQAAHQLAVFDLGNMEEINLGTIDKATGQYRSLGEAADLHSQYREQIARADEARSPAGVPGVSGLAESSSATKRSDGVVEWTGPPVVEPSQGLFGQSVDATWQGADTFDESKHDMRAGARVAQAKGYGGIDSKTRKDWEYGLPRVPSDSNVDNVDMLLGQEIVSRAVHSDPTTDEGFDALYRGMRVPRDIARQMKVKGGEISFPLSSFSMDYEEAKEWARGKRWLSQDAMGVKDAVPVVIELLPGAKVAEVSGEQVAFGRFKVVKSGKLPSPDDPNPLPVKITVRQTSMIEDAVANPKPGTSVLERQPIPEYTIVSSPEPGKPPAGMDREKWITTVQPGPIPDYDNSHAVSAQMRARHPDLEVNLGGMTDPSLARSTAQELDDLMTKYPEAQLRSAIARGPYNFQNSSRYAQTDIFPGAAKRDFYAEIPEGHLAQTQIQFNQNFYTKRETLEKSYAQTTDLASRHAPPGTNPIYGYHPPVGEGNDAAKAIAAHEFGHTMDASGSYRAGAAVKDTLRREYLRLNPYTDEQREMDRILVANAAKRGIKIRQPIETRYEAWLQDSLSGYSFTKGGQLNPAEALAEAFGHVELDPGHVTDAERALHKLAVDMHNKPYRWDLQVPEWSMGSAAQEPAMSKESKRLLKDYQKQVDRAVKAEEKARAAAERAAAKAAKEADLATPEGQIREAKIQKLKGEARKAAGDFGDPNSVENVTRRAMDPERIRKNREELWAEVPEAVRQQGKAWYPDDGQVLLDIHRDLGSPLAGDLLADLKVRAIGSAFSPQVDWADAKTDVGNYLRCLGQPYQDRVDFIVKGRPRMVYTDSIKRADRVMAAKTIEEIDLALRGSQPTSSHYYDNSQKIRHFFSNLDGDLGPLTSDTWDGRAARLSPDERRFLLNEEVRQKNSKSKRPVPLEDLDLYQKGDQIPGYLVARADKLADEANAAARALGHPEPYLPSVPLMVQYGYDIIESATAAALPKGYEMADYQAGMWVWLRGSA